jgi:uncharacterized protein DUF6894
MARYHFNLKGASFVRDHKGRELPDVTAARARATELARTLAERMSAAECDWSSAKIIVTNDRGAEVLTIPVSESMAPGVESKS